MQTFLHTAVQDLVSKTKGFTNHTIILPSKRAGVFLKKELHTIIKGPAILPVIISIEDFIADLSSLENSESTTLIFEFYSVYRQVKGEQADAFDEFIKWAPLLLQDFNELDRQLVNTDDFFNYLTDAKRLELLLTDNKLSSMITARYELYASFKKLYKTFYNHLLEKGIAYQGMQYREATRNIDLYVEHNSGQQVTFIGFNALTKAEEVIIRQLLSHKIARVYWDIDQFFYEKNTLQVKFLKKYLTSWDYYKQHPYKQFSDNFTLKKKINIIGAPKKISQLKYVGEILSELYKNPKDLQDTALVLADESLLVPALSSLPPDIPAINITMGYELGNIAGFNLFEQLFVLHSNERKSGFYYKQLLPIITDPLFISAVDNKDSVNKLLNYIITNNVVYLTQNAIQKQIDDPGFKRLLFLFDNYNGSATIFIRNALQLINILKEKIQPAGIEKEYLFRFYQIFQQLDTLNTTFNFLSDIKTLHHFFIQVSKKEKLSFKGEPLSGLQLMGVLETRVLDFKNLIITSVNEGILPSGRVENSFIPFDIKKKFGLPTYEERDAIFSYHFFRLLQRAENIFLIYDTEADSYGSGEQSRYLTQLERYKEKEIEKLIVSPNVSGGLNEDRSVEKSPTLFNDLKQLAYDGFSPTALTNYIRNPFEFYRQRLLGIRQLEEVEETIAANTLGTIIHKTLQHLYEPYKGQYLEEKHLQEMTDRYNNEISHWFIKEYHNENFKTGKNLLIYEVAKQYVSNFLKTETALINQGKSIKVLELEENLSTTTTIDGLDFPVKLIGQVDRIDEFDGTLRIIDYKTGKVEQKNLVIKNWDDLLTDYNNYSKSFQVLFYAFLYTQMHKLNTDQQPLESGIISFKNQKEGLLKVNKGTIQQNDLFIFEGLLKKLIAEIFSITLQFNDSKQYYN